MKKGYHRFLLVGVVVFCLLFGASSLIYAEEDPNTNETDPVLQVQEEVGQTIEDTELIEEGEQIEPSDQREDQNVEDMRALPALPPELNVKTVKSGISYDIVLKNVPKDSFDFIVFKVWSSKNGEDDVKVYPVKWQKDGSCKCRVLISDHKHLGDYQVVAYGVNSTETTVIDSADQITVPLLKDEDIATKIEYTSFETPVPQNGKVSVSTNYAKGTFAVKVTGIQNPGLVQRVRFAVWSKSDKSDRVWYEGTKQTDGSYTANGSIAKHSYNAGTYQIYAYAIDTKGESRLQSKTTADLNAKYTASIKSYKVTISGLKYPGGFQTVWVPSWSDKKGQDDLKWYQAVKQTNGSYVATLKAGNYKHF